MQELFLFHFLGYSCLIGYKQGQGHSCFGRGDSDTEGEFGHGTGGIRTFDHVLGKEVHTMTMNFFNQFDYISGVVYQPSMG